MWPHLTHNEDGGFEDAGTAYLVNVSVGGAPRFTALCYAGDLPSGAFGWNDFGVGFTLNYMPPNRADPDGIGRGFISRHLLTARTLEEAVAIVEGKGAAVDGKDTTPSVGHNYQLFSARDARIVAFESAPGGAYNRTEITPTANAYFHANMYLRMRNVSQESDPSSEHRLARWQKLPQKPTDAATMLQFLGDQQEKQWPVFHDYGSHARGDKFKGYTITTMHFDVHARQATMYYGNPRNLQVERTWSL